MQVKDQTVIHRNKYPLLGNLLKLGVTLTCLYFLWDQFQKQDVDFSQTTWPANATWILVLVTFLMMINWYLEALRWKISLSSFEDISIQEAWKSVLGGLALNWVFPFTSGDFAVRIIARKDKYQTTSAIILNRGIMLLLTIAYGVFSLIYLEQALFTINRWYVLIAVVLLVCVFFFRKKFEQFLTYFKSMQRSILCKVTVLSILRYLIFTFQFYLLLAAFNPALTSVIILAGIGWIFFIRSIVPHLLGGIGLREAASVVFFTTFVVDVSTILIPVFMIWLINTVIPSIAGLGLIWRTQWWRSSSKSDRLI